MAFPSSCISRQFVIDVLAGTIPVGTGTAAWAWKNSGTPATFKAALYDNNNAATKDDTAAQFAYGGTSFPSAGSATGGTGTSNSQVYQAIQWPQGGQQLGTGGTTSGTGGSGVAMCDAADLASGTACTISNAYGCLVFCDSLTSPVIDQGVCANSFGTGAAVTNGTFTIQWSANGVFRFTV